MQYWTIKTVHNKEQEEFLTRCGEALLEGEFKRVTFAARGAKKGNDAYKASFDLVLGEQRKFIKTSNSKNEDSTSPLDAEALLAEWRSAPISPFRAATLFTSTRDYHYAENRKGEPRFYSSKPSMKDVVQTHNRQKNYVLSESRPYLRGLGVTNDAGKVVKKHYGKFRQIANFVEIINRDIGDFVSQTDRPISMLDLGCGKGYLTFATYDYLRSRSKHEPQARGVDLKANVIELCNSISDELKFDGLNFLNARIEPNKNEKLDILIALHACDTATDDALALGLNSDVEFIFCAPCCQAEIAAQLKPVDSPFELVNQFPLMKRRQADIVTDVCRALLLTAMGYETKFLEFTALEHTSKNVMLTGKRSGAVDRVRAYREYLSLKSSYGFQTHALEEHLLSELQTLEV